MNNKQCELVNQSAKYVLNNVTLSLLENCINAPENVLIELVKNGADVNATNKQIRSLLLIACQRKFNQLAILLIDKEIKLNLENQDQTNPFLVACEHDMEDVIYKILDKVNEKNNFYFFQKIFGKDEIFEKYKILEKIFVNLIKETDFKYLSKEQLLVWSCSKGLSNVASLLLEQNVDVNYVDGIIGDALSWAIYNKMEIICLKLLERPEINVNHVSKEKDTALLWASYYSMEKICLRLLDKHANIFHLDRYNHDAFYYAIQNKLWDVAIKINEQSGKNKSKLLLFACKYKVTELAEKLIDYDVDVNIYDKEGRTPFVWATFNEMNDVVYKLIEKGAKIGDQIKILFDEIVSYRKNIASETPNHNVIVYDDQ